MYVRPFLWIAVMIGLALPARTAIVYDESVSPDLSNSGPSPTSLVFAVGSNTVLGTTGSSSTSGIDRDYFTFDIPVGLQFSALMVLPGTTSGGAVSFIALQSGSQVTVPTNPVTADGLLGWWHYAPGDVNTDILDNMAIATNGSSGFTPPLGSGSYAVWIQDFNGGVFPYEFDFTVSQAQSSVPEPSAIWAVLAGLGVVSWMRRSLGGRTPSGLAPRRG